MEDRDKKLLKAYAENDMSMSKTSGVVYLHYNSIRYRFQLIQRETGLNPRNFYDLEKLLAMIDAQGPCPPASVDQRGGALRKGGPI